MAGAVSRSERGDVWTVHFFRWVSLVAVRSIGGLGSYQITATIPGLPPVTFFMTNVVGPLDRLELVGGGIQSTMVNTAFAEPLKIRALDVALNPLTNVSVTFQPAAAGASATLSQLTANTDGNGEASITATANAFGGVHSVQASAPETRRWCRAYRGTFEQSHSRSG